VYYLTLQQPFHSNHQKSDMLGRPREFYRVREKIFRAQGFKWHAWGFEKSAENNKAKSFNIYKKALRLTQQSHSHSFLRTKIICKSSEICRYEISLCNLLLSYRICVGRIC